MSDSKTTILVSTFEDAGKRITEAQTALAHAQSAQASAINKLGHWLTPKVVKAGEKFCIWVHGKMMEVMVMTVSPEGKGIEYSCRWRENRKGGISTVEDSDKS